MASSSSLGNASQANATSAHAFYVSFNGSTSVLLNEIRAALTQEELQAALQRYASLGAELTRMVDSGVLPAHDQRVHRRRLEDVAAALELRRRKVGENQQGKEEEGDGKRKGGFAFRRKLPVATSAEATAAVTPAAAAPAATVVAAKDASSAVSVEPTPSTPDRESHITISALHNTIYTHSSTSNPTPISLEIVDISHSLIDLRTLCSHVVLSVQIRSVTSSILLLPPISGSAMLHHLSHSLVLLPSCHQFRMHSSHHVAVALRTKRGSVATLEACTDVTLIAGSEVKVQDFEDLFTCEELKHHTNGKQQEGNFRVVNRDDAGLADKLVKWTEEGRSVEVGLKKVWDEVVGEG